MKKKRLLPRRYKLLIYALLLIASNVVRHQQGHHARPQLHHQVVTLPEFAEGNFQDGRVEMVYHDLRPPGNSDAPVVVLIHGSPMRSSDLRFLVESMGGRYRVVAPELPGFGRSTRTIPDYSFTAMAAYLHRLMNILGVSNAHVVAYSQGGGVALELQKQAPDQIASLTLVSSIGVQEFELLGIYGLNRALHGLQLTAIGAAAILIPHFGLLDTMMLNTAYARNFFDSDLRPHRDYLKSYPGPMLLIHGRDDILVPPGTAQESRRLVPQSELAMLRGGHKIAFKKTEQVNGLIHDFIALVQGGRAVVRENADPSRVEKSVQPFNPADVDKAVGVAMVVMILLIALATLISEDLACISAGLLATQGVIDYWTAAGGAFLGIFVGDLLLFWAGHHFGKSALRKPPLKWMIKEAAIRESSKWFARKGPVVVLLSRFVPGSRFPTFFTAGMLHTKFWVFFIFFLFAGLIWAPLLVWLSMKIGQQIIETLFTYKLYTLAAITATALLLWLLFKIVIPLFSFKGRRLLLSRWRRLTRWEYWPQWIIYPPVLGYILLLGLRYRSVALFTAANPAIRLGGFIGESKKAMLDGFKERRDLIARTELIAADLTSQQKERAVIHFFDRNQLSFPVVLKPDVGQRGAGVAVIRNENALRAYFETPRPDTLVQEYVPGFEFGIFYYRMPGQPRGHIFSITEKRFPIVIGNGKHDLEHLVLKDPRAVAMAPFYLRQMDERRYMVPVEDEMIQLVELGTHCRGSLFQDGRWIKTIELERAMDELAQGFDGFYLGRFDIRAESLDDLRAGKGFKAIELNGVSSESTNIYDPRNGLMDAYAVLFKQWLIAFKIGHRNRRLGIKPASVQEMLKAVADYESPPEA
ncbi:MAG TPA: alpha/beta fold hydrolase [Kiritimatiellia bacterium]|mgnify:CR=1 FL=1|nr:alpha/beta fold hydrolase [Kiritimatiellia bacterium]